MASVYTRLRLRAPEREVVRFGLDRGVASMRSRHAALTVPGPEADVYLRQGATFERLRDALAVLAPGARWPLAESDFAILRGVTTHHSAAPGAPDAVRAQAAGLASRFERILIADRSQDAEPEPEDEDEDAGLRTEGEAERPGVGLRRVGAAGASGRRRG